MTCHGIIQFEIFSNFSDKYDDISMKYIKNIINVKRKGFYHTRPVNFFNYNELINKKTIFIIDEITSLMIVSKITRYLKVSNSFMVSITNHS